MPAVVSDTSPLIYLARLGHFQWLKDFHGEILIPPAVWSEITDAGAKWPEAAKTTQAAASGWLRVQAPTTILPAASVDDLDRGEMEAISLASELGLLLIIDEQAGRRIAASIGLKITGVLGLLFEAKVRGLIPSLRHELDRLRDETTFFLSEAVRTAVLRQAGELDTQP